MPSYHHRTAPRRSNDYYAALIRTGQYNPLLRNAEAHQLQQVARIQVATTATPALRDQALADL